MHFDGVFNVRQIIILEQQTHKLQDVMPTRTHVSFLWYFHRYLTVFSYNYHQLQDNTVVFTPLSFFFFISPHSITADETSSSSSACPHIPSCSFMLRLWNSHQKLTEQDKKKKKKHEVEQILPLAWTHISVLVLSSVPLLLRCTYQLLTPLGFDFFFQPSAFYSTAKR